VTTALVRFEAAKRALAEARTIDEVKQIRDKAEALRLYVKQQGDSLEMQNDIAEIKLRAERRAGELLAEMGENEQRQRRGGDRKSKLHDETLIEPPTLSDLGITKSQSSRWQQEAKVPEETFEQYVAETKAAKYKRMLQASAGETQVEQHPFCSLSMLQAGAGETTAKGMQKSHILYAPGGRG
jgi:hypothetical protein